MKKLTEDGRKKERMMKKTKEIIKNKIAAEMFEPGKILRLQNLFISSKFSISSFFKDILKNL